MAPTKAKKAKTERFTVERGITRKRISLTDPALKGKTTCKIISVNIPGIRALLKNEGRRSFLSGLLENENPDIFLIQEHKLQEMHLEKEKSVKDFLETEVKDYESYWSFSTAKKGYSGVASFVKKEFLNKYPIKNIKYKLIEDGHIFDDEGRVIILEFDTFEVYNLYVPNSGQKLQRLDNRINEWDNILLKSYKLCNKSIISLGDMNVAYRVKDMHNFYHKGDLNIASQMKISEEQYKGVRNLLKLSGCTVQERNSFDKLLADGCVVDSFIKLNGDVKGCFTYWTVRSNNRPFNQGLRLDYVLCSPELLNKENSIQLVDTFHLDDLESEGWGLSDHCPIGTLLTLN